MIIIFYYVRQHQNPFSKRSIIISIFTTLNLSMRIRILLFWSVLRIREISAIWFRIQKKWIQILLRKQNIDPIIRKSYFFYERKIYLFLKNCNMAIFSSNKILSSNKNHLLKGKKNLDFLYIRSDSSRIWVKNFANRIRIGYQIVRIRNTGFDYGSKSFFKTMFLPTCLCLYPVPWMNIG